MQVPGVFKKEIYFWKFFKDFIKPIKLTILALVLILLAYIVLFEAFYFNSETFSIGKKNGNQDIIFNITEQYDSLPNILVILLKKFNRNFIIVATNHSSFSKDKILEVFNI